MRALVIALFAIPLLLAACGDHQDFPAGPATVPDVVPAMASAALRSAAIDPSHTYRFETTCSAGAGNSLIHISNDGVIGSLYVTCNSFTELGAAYGTTFSTYGVDITLDPGGTVCSQPGLTRTGTVRCKSRKLSAALTVVDEGVL
ncbi:MAG TPA: hypothetical protein VFJ81_10775 [Gemmatimonadales bacterium]|nr:hypothetical protein [Gemmatimonadales bacterium]